jgi:hypothetical protein
MCPRLLRPLPHLTYKDFSGLSDHFPIFPTETFDLLMVHCFPSLQFATVQGVPPGPHVGRRAAAELASRVGRGLVKVVEASIVLFSIIVSMLYEFSFITKETLHVQDSEKTHRALISDHDAKSVLNGWRKRC